MAKEIIREPDDLFDIAGVYVPTAVSRYTSITLIMITKVS